MVEPDDLLGHIRLVLGRDGPLAGRSVVVTAGPTREPIDAVRFKKMAESMKDAFGVQREIPAAEIVKAGQGEQEALAFVHQLPLAGGGFAGHARSQ